MVEAVSLPMFNTESKCSSTVTTWVLKGKAGLAQPQLLDAIMTST